MLTNCTYLEDSECVVDGVRIYGAPWQPEFCGWAFNASRGAPLDQVGRPAAAPAARVLTTARMRTGGRALGARRGRVSCGARFPRASTCSSRTGRRLGAATRRRTRRALAAWTWSGASAEHSRPGACLTATASAAACVRACVRARARAPAAARPDARAAQGARLWPHPRGLRRLERRRDDVRERVHVRPGLPAIEPAHRPRRAHARGRGRVLVRPAFLYTSLRARRCYVHMCKQARCRASPRLGAPLGAQAVPKPHRGAGHAVSHEADGVAAPHRPPQPGGEVELAVDELAARHLPWGTRAPPARRTHRARPR